MSGSLFGILAAVFCVYVWLLTRSYNESNESIYVVGDRVRHVISGRVGVVTAQNANGTVTVGYDISEGGDCCDAELEIIGAPREG